MKRRILLERLSTVGAAGALAGCLGNVRGDSGKRPDDDGEAGNDPGEPAVLREDDDVAEDEAAEDGDVEISDQEITTNAAECGEGNGASIAFADDAVEIEGRLPASDPCYEAILEEVTIENGELEVTIGAKRVDEDDVCIQCIARVDYEATICFESECPQIGTVRHEGTDETEEVARERREN